MVLYDLLLGLILILGSPWWLLRMLTSGRYRAGLTERLGRVPPDLAAFAAQSTPLLWIHAVSVGEVLIATRLIAALEEAMAAGAIAPVPIVLSSTTETGHRLARERLPHIPVFYLPLDLRYAVRRYLAVLRPRAFVTIESELWPRLIHECARRGILLAVVNARISDRSLPRYLRLRRLWLPLLSKVDLFLAQSSETAARLRQIGVSGARIQVTGNLKYDLQAPSERPLTTHLRSILPSGAPVIVAGSTLEGEEQMLLTAWPAVLAAEPRAVLILSPRHPDRFNAVASLALALPVPLFRATGLADSPALSAPMPSGSILLLDTIGDLASIYALATVAVVGGSLVDRGGHNPLEPARFAVPTLIGPHVQNFRQIVETLRAADAIRIVPPACLAAELISLLTHSAEAVALGLRAQAVFHSEAGASARTVAALAALLNGHAADKPPVTEVA